MNEAAPSNQSCEVFFSVLSSNESCFFAKHHIAQKMSNKPLPKKAKQTANMHNLLPVD